MTVNSGEQGARGETTAGRSISRVEAQLARIERMWACVDTPAMRRLEAQVARVHHMLDSPAMRQAATDAARLTDLAVAPIGIARSIVDAGVPITTTAAAMIAGAGIGPTTAAMIAQGRLAEADALRVLGEAITSPFRSASSALAALHPERETIARSMFDAIGGPFGVGSSVGISRLTDVTGHEAWLPTHGLAAKTAVLPIPPMPTEQIFPSDVRWMSHVLDEVEEPLDVEVVADESPAERLSPTAVVHAAAPAVIVEQPPETAEFLLELFVRAQDHHMIGDLVESYRERWVPRYGRSRANTIFWARVAEVACQRLGSPLVAVLQYLRRLFG